MAAVQSAVGAGGQDASSDTTEFNYRPLLGQYKRIGEAIASATLQYIIASTLSLHPPKFVLLLPARMEKAI
jgi:hypothetical protein